MKQIVLLFMLAKASTLIAGEQVEGAFGLKLGEAFEPTTHRAGLHYAPSPGGWLNADDAYEFTPKKPNPAFSNYTVFITPNSHVIYCIEAIHKEPGDARDCYSFMRGLRVALWLKYEGKFDEKSPQTGVIGEGARWLDTRDVEVNAQGHECQFALDYWDKDLAAKGQQEREQNRVQKALEGAKTIDATGL
jgi:hypothetical protein